MLSIVAAGGARESRGVRPASISLALGGLPPEELSRLRERIEESADAALRRAAPDLLDMGSAADDAAAADAASQVGPDLPALTAAVNLGGAPWSAPGISVRLGPGCDPAASRCVPLFAAASSEPEDPLARRARSLAWALSNAARVRAPPSSRTALVRSLRTAQRRPSSAVAIVFDAARGTLDGTELDLLRREARRAMEPLGPDAPQRPWLEAVAGAQATWELPIDLEPGELLVVPRLSALARLADFTSEVESSGTFTWVTRPGAMRAR
ncbi:MAG TPA: hypothetical protein VKU41_03695 [Polyangiaceae bacterium]|nr:hypothetical protein [Polyangiaceae bacterium]